MWCETKDGLWYIKLTLDLRLNFKVVPLLDNGKHSIQQCDISPAVCWNKWKCGMVFPWYIWSKSWCTADRNHRVGACRQTYVHTRSKQSKTNHPKQLPVYTLERIEVLEPVSVWIDGVCRRFLWPPPAMDIRFILQQHSEIPRLVGIFAETRHIISRWLPAESVSWLYHYVTCFEISLSSAQQTTTNTRNF